jgi:hypothetical protein
MDADGTVHPRSQGGDKEERADQKAARHIWTCKQQITGWVTIYQVRSLFI